jgi:hypothetical protein
MEAASAVSMRPRSEFRCINETAEAASAVSMRPQNPLKNSTTLFLHRKVVFSAKLRLAETAEADSAVSMRPRKRIQRSQ